MGVWCVVGGRVRPSRPNVTQTSETSVELHWTLPSDHYDTSIGSAGGGGAGPAVSVVLLKVQYQQVKPSRHRWQTLDDDLPATARQFQVTSLTPGMCSNQCVLLCQY